MRLSCDDRSKLRMTVGLSGLQGEVVHELKPEVFNGWPLFRNRAVGEVPLAGPGDEGAIEVGVDLSSLFAKVLSEAKGLGKSKGRFFLKIYRADGSKASGELLECALRSYDKEGKFEGESLLKFEGGRFGDAAFELDKKIRVR